MRATTPENPVSTAYTQNKDTIDAFVAGVTGLGVSENARLDFASAHEDSSERAFQQLYGGLVVSRSLSGYYDGESENFDQAKPSFRVDLVESPVGLPNLEAEIIFLAVSLDDGVWSAANFLRHRALHNSLIHSLKPDIFAVAQTYPPDYTSVVGVGSGRFGIDESWPMARTAAALINLGAGAIKKAGLETANRLTRNESG